MSVVSWGLWTNSSSSTDACSASWLRLRIGRVGAGGEMSRGDRDDSLRDTQAGMTTLGRARSSGSTCCSACSTVGTNGSSQGPRSEQVWAWSSPRSGTWGGDGPTRSCWRSDCATTGRQTTGFFLPLRPRPDNLCFNLFLDDPRSGQLSTSMRGRTESGWGVKSDVDDDPVDCWSGGIAVDPIISPEPLSSVPGSTWSCFAVKPRDFNDDPGFFPVLVVWRSKRPAQVSWRRYCLRSGCLCPDWIDSIWTSLSDPELGGMTVKVPAS